MDKSLILDLGQEKHKIRLEQLVFPERKKQNKTKQNKPKTQREGLGHIQRKQVKVKVHSMTKMEQVDKYNK